MRSVGLFAALVLLSLTVNAQQLRRANIGSLNTSYSNSSAALFSSLGQSSAAGTLSEDSITLRQGFQQPHNVVFVGITDRPTAPIRVFPNPALENTNITIDLGEESKADITLMNLAGAVIWTKRMNAPTAQFALNNLQPAIYLLRIATNDGVRQRRIVVL